MIAPIVAQASSTVVFHVHGAATPLAIVAAFLVGSIPFGLLVGRLVFRSDIRTSGSGNIGAANALRTYGRGAGVAVLLLDALKGALPVLYAQVEAYRRLAALDARQIDVTGLARFLDTGPALLGVAAVLGHCYSPWLRFHGGKGVATFLGATIALQPLGGLVFALVWAAVAIPTGYASLASIVATLAASVTVVVLAHATWPTDLFAVACSTIVIVRHRENLARLRAGTETKTRILGRRSVPPPTP